MILRYGRAVGLGRIALRWVERCWGWLVIASHYGVSLTVSWEGGGIVSGCVVDRFCYRWWWLWWR